MLHSDSITDDIISQARLNKEGLWIFSLVYIWLCIVVFRAINRLVFVLFSFLAQDVVFHLRASLRFKDLQQFHKKMLSVIVTHLFPKNVFVQFVH